MRALCRFWLSAAFLWSTASFAAEATGAKPVSFLPPAACLPGDGGPAYDLYLFIPERSGPAEDFSIQAEKGQVRALTPVGGGLYRLQYAPPRLDGPEQILFETRGPDSQTRLPLCPHPAGRIRLRVEPGKLLAGMGQRATLHIEVEDAAGRVRGETPPQISVNVGQIGAIEREGAGRFRAEYTPPSDPFPQVAILMVAHAAGARMERVAVERAIIPITARIELPGRTAPGTSMQMVVAGRRFGPVRADRRGRFHLPILVPPGYGRGQATSIDRAGNRRTRTIDLFLPETNQLGLWAFPMVLPADGRSRSRLLVTTINRFGESADIEAGGGEIPVRIRAARGTVSKPRRLGQGLFEAYYTAPEQVGSGQDDLRVTFPQGGSESKASLRIRLSPGPASRAELTVPEILPADGQTRGAVSLRVSDGKGNPVPREVVAFQTSTGRIVDPEETAAGVHRASLIVDPNPERWQAQVRVQVEDRRGTRPARILLGADGLRPSGAPPGTAVLEAVVVDGTGLPVPEQTVRLDWDDQRLEASSDAFGRVRFSMSIGGARGPRSSLLHLAADEAIHKQFYWTGGRGSLRLLPVDLDRALPASTPLRATKDVRLYPPVGVQIRVDVDAAKVSGATRPVRIRLSDAAGGPLAGRALSLRVSAGHCGEVTELGGGRYEARWTEPAGPWQQATLSVVDTSSGVGAVTTIVRQPGGGR